VNKTTCNLYVPKGTKSLYEAAPQWQDFMLVEWFPVINTEIINANKMAVYPNPVTDGFHISGINEKSTLNIFDINGKLLLTKEIDDSEYVTVSSLPQGIYLVRISSDAGVFEKKLVKK
jgi:hypothetical protein